VNAEDRIANCIRAALESKGVNVLKVVVSDYDPASFGDHFARVETSDGTILVIHDRQYEVNLMDSRIAPQRIPEIKRSLTAKFRQLD
jgi:hypothetical protein